MKDLELDCTGMRCPMPIMKISVALKSAEVGQRIQVRATDPAFKADVEAWVRRVGQKLLEFRDGPVQEAVIEKVT